VTCIFEAGKRGIYYALRYLDLVFFVVLYCLLAGRTSAKSSNSWKQLFCCRVYYLCHCTGIVFCSICPSVYLSVCTKTEKSWS